MGKNKNPWSPWKQIMLSHTPNDPAQWMGELDQATKQDVAYQQAERENQMTPRYDPGYSPQHVSRNSGPGWDDTVRSQRGVERDAHDIMDNYARKPESERHVQSDRMFVPMAMGRNYLDRYNQQLQQLEMSRPAGRAVPTAYDLLKIQNQLEHDYRREQKKK